MPLTNHAPLIVAKPIKAEIMVKCFHEPLTNGFPDTDAVLENNNADRNKKSNDDTEELKIPFSVLALYMGKGVVRELLVDPVYHGWRRVLRIIGYLQSWSSIYRHNSHNEIQWYCKIFILGSTLWDPLIEVKRAQDYFFRWETDRIKLNHKKYPSIWISLEFSLKKEIRSRIAIPTPGSSYLENLDKHEIKGSYGGILWYCIHTCCSFIPKPTCMLHWNGMEIHKFMRVPKGLRRL